MHALHFDLISVHLLGHSSSFLSAPPLLLLGARLHPCMQRLRLQFFPWSSPPCMHSKRKSAGCKRPSIDLNFFSQSGQGVQGQGRERKRKRETTYVRTKHSCTLLAAGGRVQETAGRRGRQKGVEVRVATRETSKMCGVGTLPCPVLRCMHYSSGSQRH
jgi:hypothetical protein